MLLQLRSERLELRVFVDERGVEPDGRSRDKGIGERNLVRCLEPCRLVAKCGVRVKPLDRHGVEVGQPLAGRLRSLLLRGDLFHLGQSGERAVQMNPPGDSLRNIRLHFVRAGFVPGQGQNR